MCASKIVNKGWLVFFASLFLWVDTAIGDSPEEFHLKTPLTRLTVPIDFNEVVYAETTKTAEVSFNWQYDRTSPNLLQVYSSLVDVNPHDIKNSFKIKRDWQRKIAKVTSSYTVKNQPQEDTRDYRIISYDPKNVCLVYETDNAVVVITMNSDIGSFVMSRAWAPGFGIVNGTSIWYGFLQELNLCPAFASESESTILTSGVA